MRTLPFMAAAILLNFVIMHLAPGDPARMIAGQYADEAVVDYYKKLWGLDKPLYEQVVYYFARVLMGDLGVSHAYSKPVTEVIGTYLPNTLLLLLCAYLPAFTLGAFLGAYAMKKESSKIDVSLSFLMLAFWSTPVYWLGLMFILLFALYLAWFPTSGMYSVMRVAGGFAGSLPDLLWHMFLPIITVTLVDMATFQQVARASVAEAIKEDYITAARARGLSERTIFFKHALRNGLLPVVTKASMWISSIFGGSVILETVFGWPGVGRLMYNSILHRDYPLTMGIFMITTLSIMTGALLTDILYAYLDPRIELR